MDVGQLSEKLTLREGRLMNNKSEINNCSKNIYVD